MDDVDSSADRPSHRSAPPFQSYPPLGDPRPTLYRIPDTRICFFYKAGDANVSGVRVAVNPRSYPSVETLKNELTDRVAGLPFGVRSIYTPTGSRRIESIDSLQNNSRYICSSYNAHAAAVDVTRLDKERVWRASQRPATAQRLHNALLGGAPLVAPIKAIRLPKRNAWSTPEASVPRAPPVTKYYSAPSQKAGGGGGGSRAPKKITVVMEGEEGRTQTLLLYRRTAQTFEQIVEDLSSMFGTPIRSICTQDRRPVRSLSAIFSGPDVYVVSGDAATTDRSDPSSDFTRQRAPMLGRAWTRRSLPTRKKEGVFKDKTSTTRGSWAVWVTTSDDPAAGTQAAVCLTVYGARGDSGPLTLGDSDGQIFQPGHVDQFEVSLGNIGEIFKIRISHNNLGDVSDWLCDEVRMKDKQTGEELSFKCNRWLSRNKDDGEICREIPVTRNGQPVLPVVHYEVNLYTGELWNAGTDSNVSVTLFGERGDSGARQMYNRKKTEGCFVKGKMDAFTVEAVWLGNITMVVASCDDSGSNKGWYLDKIVIRDQSRSGQKWIFPCRRWLSEREDDGKMVRELKQLDPATEEQFHRQLYEYEKWKYLTGSQVVLYSKTTLRPLRIKSDGSVDASGEHSDPLGAFMISSKKGSSKLFQSVANPQCYLAAEHGKLLGTGKGGTFCEFNLHVQRDRSVMLESGRSPLSYVSVLADGAIVMSPGPSESPSILFHIYCKGTLHDRNVLYLCSSVSQTLCADNDGTLRATGQRVRSAQFRVHHVRGAGVCTFESIALPKRYIRMTGGECDVGGSGDDDCQFRVTNVKQKGYLTLESVSNPDQYVGMTPEGWVTPTSSTARKNARFYPEILEFGLDKQQSERSYSQQNPVSSAKQKHLQVQRAKHTASVQSTQELAAASPDHPPYTDGDWKVWVSSDTSATDSIITLVVFGDEGDSGPIILGEAGPNGLFQANNVDEFKVNLRSVGAVYKVRLECNPQEVLLDPGWKVKEMRIQNMKSRERLMFRFNRWFSRQRDDLEIMRELPAVRPRQSILPVVIYQVEVKTGVEPDAGTQANVFVNLTGELGDTGRRLLLASDNPVKFKLGQVDTFSMEAVYLGALTLCHVSHDGQAAGQGWFCDVIVVRLRDAANQAFIFPCNRWLDIGMDDQKIERTLKVDERLPSAVKPDKKQKVRVPGTPAPPKDKPKSGDWLISVTTGANDNMSTIGTVILYAYGSEAVFGPIVLADNSSGEYFQPGTTDEFKVNLGSKLGMLYKVRIGLQLEDGLESGWFLEKMTMKDLSAKELLAFRVNRWMSRGEDDCDVCRELAVSRQGRRPLPVILYQVEVYTADEPGAGTLAPVYIQLFGSRGDSGRRLLYKSKNNPIKLRQGQMDLFDVEAVTLDDVSKVVIGHNCRDEGAGWKCERVVVREGETSLARVFTFHCGRWLDVGRDDGGIERVLVAGAPLLPTVDEDKVDATVAMSPEPPKENTVQYKLHVYTGDRRGAGTEASAYVTMYGAKGSSGKLRLNQSTNNSKKLLRSQMDVFEMDTEDIGIVDRLIVGHDGVGRGQGWFCDKITVRRKDWDHEVIFPCSRWFDTGCDDRKIERELRALGEQPLKDNKLNNVPSKGSYKVQFTKGMTFTKPSLPDNPETKNDNKTPLDNYGSPDLEIREADDDAFDDDDDDYEGNFNSNNGNELIGDDVMQTLWVYGERGMTGPIDLDAEESSLSGPTGELHIEVGDIGSISKIRVCSEQQGDPSKVIWTLKELIFDDVDTKERLRFDFSRWVGEVGGDICKELPALRANSQSVPDLVEYQVTVVTAGDSESMNDTASDPTVHVSLYGSPQDSGLRRMFNVSSGAAFFQPGQESVFALQAVDLGSLRRVVACKTGGVAWHLKQIRVKRGRFAPTEDIFNYDNCSDHHMPYKIRSNKTVLTACVNELITEDGEEIDVLLSESRKGNMVDSSTRSSLSKSAGRWKVWLSSTNPDRNESEEDGSLVLVLCTEKSESQPHTILAGQENSAQRIQISAGNGLNDLYKVRVGFADNFTACSLFLKKLRFEDEDNHDTFDVEANEWITVDEVEDGWREYPVVWPGVDPPKVVQYCISTYTGELQRTEPRTSIFVNIMAANGQSGRRLLKKSRNNSVKFLRGQMDIFEFSAVELQEMNKLVVGHDCLDPGAGWYLDKVVVNATDESIDECIFSCQRWLDKGEEDKAIVRILSLSQNDQSFNPVQAEQWTVRIAGGVNGGSTAWADQLVVVIYGEMGKSDEICLSSPTDMSAGGHAVQQQHTRSYEIEVMRTLGAVYKVRVGLTTPCSHTAVPYLDQLRLKRTKLPAEELVFVYGKLLPNGPSSDCWVEIPLEQPDRRNNLPVVNYEVKVFTGDVTNAGTTANVRLMIVGTRGDSGARKLVHSNPNASTKFDRADVDIFTIRAVTLEEPIKIVVGHDGHGDSPGWFLDRVLIRSCLSQTEGERSSSELQPVNYVFLCERWLDVNKGDGLTEVEFLQTHSLPEQPLLVPEPVGKLSEVSTPKAVPSNKTQNTAAAAAPTIAAATAEPLAANSKTGGAWTVSIVTGIYQPDLDDEEEEVEPDEDDLEEEEEMDLPELNTNNNANDDDMDNDKDNDKEDAKSNWAPDDDSDEEINRILYQGKPPTSKRRSQKYSLTPSAPTGKLWIVLYGDTCKTLELPLITDRPALEMFQPGSTERFQIQADKVLGTVYKIRMGFEDDTTEEQNWLIDKVMLDEAATSRRYIIGVKDRLIRDETSDGCKEFPVTRRLDARAPPGDATAEEPVILLPVYRYMVTVYTSTVPNAGTDAEISIMLFGERGDTGRRRLLKSLNPNSDKIFQSGHMNQFELYAVDLLKLKKIVIGHDEKERGKGWHLDKVVVDLSLEGLGSRYRFDCNKWLDPGEDDKVTIRTFELTADESDLTANQSAQKSI